MRKNTQRIWNAFQQGERLGMRRSYTNGPKSIWTDGETIYSYGTALLTRTPSGMLILNATKYSPTTTRHQSGLRTLLLGERFDSITGAPRGFSAASLSDCGRQG